MEHFREVLNSPPTVATATIWKAAETDPDVNADVLSKRKNIEAIELLPMTT